MKLLLYCTKAKPYLNDYRLMEGCNQYVVMSRPLNAFNGKIVAECDFEVSKIELHQCFYNYGPAYFTKREKPYKYFSYDDLLEASCLKDNEMIKYLGKKGGYAIHIKNLHIFDESKPLQLYSSIQEEYKAIEKAPQNMCNAYYDEGTIHYILISIRPEWIVKILNGEKTIEVRKKIIKEMIQ